MQPNFPPYLHCQIPRSVLSTHFASFKPLASSFSRSTNQPLGFCEIFNLRQSRSEIVETMLHPQYDQSSSASLFAGPGIMPIQPTPQAADSSVPSSKGQSTIQGVIPVTVKQIADAFASCGDKSNPNINGVDISIVRVLGLVTNKEERLTDVSFTIDDGTGKINFHRWVDDASDTSKLAPIQNGMYVSVHGDLKGFQGNMSAFVISARPLTDFNDIILHFIECAHTNILTARAKMVTSAYGGIGSGTGQVTAGQTPAHFSHTNATYSDQFSGSTAYQAPFPNQTNQATHTYSSMDTNRNAIFGMVLEVFQDPANTHHEHGLHIDDVIRKLGVPRNNILEAVNYLVDVGHIYSTIDDNHYKSAQNY